MAINYCKLDYIQNPDIEDIPEQAEAWLMKFHSATVIDFKTDEKKPWRVITTLLHGNEPSGFYALHKLIRENSFKDLAVNVRVIVASVEAAQYGEPFSHRYLPGGSDLNRCFGSSSLSHYYLRAQVIASSIRQVKPEAVIDLHNTSGNSPAFIVSCNPKRSNLNLAALFADAMIVSHIRLGALMEQDFGCPIITVECGGASQDSAHQLAYTGIQKFIAQEEKSCITQNVEVIYQPIRVKVANGAKLAFSDSPQPTNLTLREDIEDINFHDNIKGLSLGWTDKNGLGNIMLESPTHVGNVSDYFSLDGDQLICHKDMKIFMATKQAEIAINDCLFYLA